MIDPWDGEFVWQFCQNDGLVLSGILNTHQHHDHIKGNPFLTEKGVPVLERMESITPGVGKKLTWRAPGHTMEHVVFWLHDGDQTHCFVGDTLFQAGVGNCKNGGDPATLYESIHVLMAKLTPETFMHPGHDYLERNLLFAQHVEPSNLEVQKRIQGLQQGPKTYERPAHQWNEEALINPFLRTSHAQLNLATTADNDQMVFKVLRQMRDNW